MHALDDVRDTRPNAFFSIELVYHATGFPMVHTVYGLIQQVRSLVCGHLSDASRFFVVFPGVSQS